MSHILEFAATKSNQADLLPNFCNKNEVAVAKLNFKITFAVR